MARKVTTEEFISRARLVHGDKYDYSKTIYKNATEKVIITCPIHGDFLQYPYSHLQGNGCKKCAHIKHTTESFIEEARKIHGDKYDYSKSKYIDMRTKLCIICPIHGEFWQIPHSHLNGCGCEKCFHDKERMSKNEFINRAREIHGDFYDYSKVIYKNSYTKVEIICPIHGSFFQAPQSHLSNFGCQLCGRKAGNEKSSLGLEEFVKRAKEIHGDNYDYSLVDYKNSYTKVLITCNVCGTKFWQTPNSHLQGCRCMNCVNNEKRLSTEEFIKRANIIHNNKYDYSETNYIDYNTKLKIICPEHGAFYQLPNSHLQGYGCHLCTRSRGEDKISLILSNNNVKYETHKKFLNDTLFGTKLFYVDFYLPDYNIVIEYNGGQHYFSVKYFGGEQKFQKQQERDFALRQFCKEHEIKLIEIPYTEFNNIETILKNELKIK